MQRPPRQLFAHLLPLAQTCSQLPPVQPNFASAFAFAVWVHLPPAQVKSQFAPDSQVWLQLPPEHVARQVEPDSQVNAQSPEAHVNLQESLPLHAPPESAAA